MTPNSPDADPPRLDCTVVSPHRDGDGVVLDKSVVEAALDERDHRLVPDGRRHRASDELLDAVADALTHPVPSRPADIAADCREAARVLRRLRRETVPVYVTRRGR
jgi:hypothetical protein